MKSKRLRAPTTNDVEVILTNLCTLALQARRMRAWLGHAMDRAEALERDADLFLAVARNLLRTKLKAPSHHGR